MFKLEPLLNNMQRLVNADGICSTRCTRTLVSKNPLNNLRIALKEFPRKYPHVMLRHSAGAAQRHAKADSPPTPPRWLNHRSFLCPPNTVTLPIAYVICVPTLLDTCLLAFRHRRISPFTLVGIMYTSIARNIVSSLKYRIRTNLTPNLLNFIIESQYWRQWNTLLELPVIHRISWRCGKQAN